MGNDWTVEAASGNVHIIRFDDIATGWEQYVLLSSDRHHDNAHCNQRLERKHLELAKERNAPILDFGDLFCAMQGKWDPRKDYEQMRPEYAGNNYLDRLVDVGANFYGPYADLIAVLGKGNHETSISKHHETDLTVRLARRLRFAGERKDWPFAGGFGGWVIFRFKMSGRHQALRLKYHHGAGGGGPVTKGVIKTNRRAVYLPDADIVASGHIHEAWTLPIPRERLSQRGKPYIDYQWHVQIPGYKDEYADGSEGFHIERERPPKPTGCVWIKFTYESKRIRVKPEIDLD